MFLLIDTGTLLIHQNRKENKLSQPYLISFMFITMASNHSDLFLNFFAGKLSVANLAKVCILSVGSDLCCQSNCSL